MDRPKNIVNIHDLELQPRPPQFAPTGPAADRYEARAALVSRQMGAKKLGFNVTAVPPGKRAFPLHNHQTTEEMFFILEGEGQLRLGKETYPVRAGDLVSCPPGGRDTAHQFINTGAVELKFLAISTREQIDLCDYPDTGKFAVLAEMAPEDGKPRMLSFVGREGQGNVGYWDGE
ncbi:MAG: cupin domain-containing protein [Asticcacaulis sp.]|nr:cupin domain-containing protein [Asticcacaulis sp.]